MTEGMRKYSITVSYLLTSIGLVVFGQVPAEDWMKFSSMVLMTYMGANVGEHFSKKPSLLAKIKKRRRRAK